MVFVPPSWVPTLPDPPDSVTVEQFIRDPAYGRLPVADSLHPYTCGLTGKTYSAQDVFQRVDYLSRAIAKRLAFDPSDGTEWDRVVGLYSLNTIDYVPFSHSIHRLSGIVTPANASYSHSELEHQLRTSGAKALFTCAPLLENALKAAKAAGIPKEKIFLLSVPKRGEKENGFKTIDDLVEEGRSLDKIPEVKLIPGQGKRQVAYLCYSSGTSGLPKAVMLTHHNIISNILQCHVHELPHRTAHGIRTQTSLGLLPLGHIYGLTLVAHVAQYRGDRVVILPQFELESFLSAIERYRIDALNVVPPVLISMMNNKDRCRGFDLSSVRHVNSGAAPLGEETMNGLKREFPTWNLGQAYGMTEASPAVTMTSEMDRYPGSSGSLVAGTRVKIIDADGKEVTQYDTRGEMLIQGPNVVRGYLNNEKANAETFVWHEDGPWLRTGDEVVVRKSPKGHEHWFVVDRIKELIKVKGFQVAPAELESHILDHPSVSDCTVISVPHSAQGEAPRAYIVKATSAANVSDEQVAKDVQKHVEDHKARYKWLKGGVEFIEAIPKSASGKILRRVVKEMDKERRRKEGAKM